MLEVGRSYLFCCFLWEKCFLYFWFGNQKQFDLGEKNLESSIRV